jgi:hypothetical protein
MNFDGWVTIPEAGLLLGLSPITLRVQIRNQKLKAKKHGRDWFVSQREVERYRKENKREVSNVETTYCNRLKDQAAVVKAKTHSHLWKGKPCDCDRMKRRLS